MGHIITMQEIKATFVKFMHVIQYADKAVKNKASKILRFDTPIVLPFEITFLLRKQKLRFSSSLELIITPPFCYKKNQEQVLVFNGVFLVVIYIITRHHEKVNKIVKFTII